MNASLAPGSPLPKLDDEVRATLRGAERWHPMAPPGLDRARLRRAVASLESVRGRGLFAAGLADPGTAALRDWLGRGATGRAPRAVAALIGQGAGLTPAGDDVVGGALVALRLTRRHALAARLSRWALARAPGRTNRISRAHLACAARGEGGEALHAFITAMLSGRRDLSRELAALDAIGHTSGWDAAAGARLALEFVAGSR